MQNCAATVENSMAVQGEKKSNVHWWMDKQHAITTHTMEYIDTFYNINESWRHEK